MDWPKELLEVFDDPLLAGVRPLAVPMTPADRMGPKLLLLKEWIARNGREPQKDGSFEEKKMYASMIGLRRQNMI